MGLVGNALKSACYYDGSTAFTVTTPDDESTFTDVGAEFLVHNNNLYIYEVDVLAVQASADAEFSVSLDYRSDSYPGDRPDVFIEGSIQIVSSCGTGQTVSFTETALYE